MIETHVDDGALVRWLDGETEGAERRDLAAHLAACAACEERLAGLRDRAARVARALARADEPGARVPSSGGWGLRVAAGFVVLFGVGVAVEPVRAWILDRAEHVWTAVTGDRAAPPEAPAGRSAAGQDLPAGSVTFVPSGEEFVLEVVARQAAGQLVIETVGAGAASAAVEGGGGSESLVVLPSGLRVVNGPGSRADYLVRVPVGLRAIVLVLGREAGRRYEPTQVGERWTVPLGDRNPG